MRAAGFRCHFNPGMRVGPAQNAVMRDGLLSAFIDFHVPAALVLGLFGQWLVNHALRLVRHRRDNRPIGFMNAFLFE